MADDIPLILLLLVLLGGAVFLGAAEAAVLRVRLSAIEVLADAGDRRARRLVRLLNDLPRVMNTVLLTVLLVQIGAATVTGVLTQRHFGNLGVSIASVTLTLVLFVYAEAIPKTYALSNPRRVAIASAPVLAMLRAALRPVVSALVWLADIQAPQRGRGGGARVTEAELRRLAAEAAASGEIAPSDLELMERAFLLGDERVDAILVPRVDVIAVAADAGAHEALDVAIASGHRRLPVYENAPDDLTGVVWLRDLARAVADSTGADVATLARPVLVVPESKRVIELLREMQQAGSHFAVAVDEYGTTAGILTIEDVVAELVGRIADEGEVRRQPLHQLGSGRWQVDAGVSVAELEAALGEALPTGDWRTVGGLVTGVAGRLVEVGESVEIGDFDARVIAATDRRLREIELTRRPADSEAE